MIPADVTDAREVFAECYFRLNKQDVPEKIKKIMPKCIRAEGCFCNLDGLVKKEEKGVCRQ